MNWEYITGFFDADGSISLMKPTKNKNRTVSVSFNNNEKCILEKIKTFIYEDLKIKGSLSKKTPKNDKHNINYTLTYSYNNALKVIDKINTIHPKKIHRKNIVIDNYKKLTPRNGKYSENMLKEREKMVEDFFSF